MSDMLPVFKASFRCTPLIGAHGLMIMLIAASSSKDAKKIAREYCGDAQDEITHFQVKRIAGIACTTGNPGVIL